MDIETALRIMRTTVALPGESSTQLCTEVSALAASLHPGHRVKSVIPAAGLGFGAPVRPMDAMLELARATRPHVSDDVFVAYKHWAWLRYLGVFDLDAHRALGLSEAGRKVHGNQRRVLSEELGVGFGVLLAKRWCRALGATGTITPVDLDVVLTEGYAWTVPLSARNVTVKGRQPDYLLLVDDASAPLSKTLKVVECKGTKAPSYAPIQIARALTQLGSLTVDGRTPTGLAVSTVSTRDEVSYLAVDPEDPDELSYLVDDQAVRSIRRDKALRADDGAIDLDPTELLGTAVTISAGALADYAGNVEAATSWLPPSTTERLSRSPKPRVTRENEMGEFRGVEYVFPTPDGRRVLRVFEGVETGVDQALTSERVEDVVAATARTASRFGSAEPLDLPSGESEATAVSSDGAILQVSVD
jgi:hypothetical protein